MTAIESKNTHKDIIADGIAALSAQLAAGNSAALTAYLGTMGRFHNYSFGNVMAIAMQRPDAVRVAGFHTWKSLGRNVKKGEKAIRILAPMVGKDKENTNDDGKPGSRVYGFRGVCVFDISQTEGKDLPEFAKVNGNAGEFLATLEQFARESSIIVEYVPDLGGAAGVSYGGKIQLLENKPAAETFSVLTHELAHELLHKQDRKNTGGRDRRELEAEAVAFIVGSAIGLDMNTASADYICLYNGNPDALTESLDGISKAAKAILAALNL
jgi:N-terminal domain of anti-restriction factor ArdC